MKVKPVIITPSNPVGLDKVVAEITQKLLSITYVDKAANTLNYFDSSLLLPVAQLDEKTEKPVVYWKGKEYFSSAPNDNYRSVTYFYQEDPNDGVSYNESTFNLNLVHWYNQDKLGRNLNYSIREAIILAFKKEIIAYLRTENMSSLTTFRETDKVFEKHTFSSDKTLMKYPYDAFRMSFEVTIENECGDNLINLA